MLQIIRDQLHEANIFQKTNTQFFNDDGYQMHNHTKPYYKLTCYEDMYLSQRSGIWMQKSYNLMELRKDLLWGKFQKFLKYQKAKFI